VQFGHVQPSGSFDEDFWSPTRLVGLGDSHMSQRRAVAGLAKVQLVQDHLLEEGFAVLAGGKDMFVELFLAFGIFLDVPTSSTMIASETEPESTCTSSSSVRSTTLLSMLALAAFSASLCARAPETQVLSSRSRCSAAFVKG